MKSAVISVGTELLFGQIVNTNTVYLSKQLNIMGIDVMYHYTVGDNPERLAKIIDLAFEDCDLVITTGGLGPTQDDLTKEIAAKALDDHLILHQPALDWIENYFKKLKRPMTENNKKQAYLPSRCTVFDNDAGTAPGFALENQGKRIICLPGPPREMKNMFEKKALPYLQGLNSSVIYYKVLRMFGIGESALETELLDLINVQTDPTLATYAKEGECSVRVASKRKTLEEAQNAVADMIKKVEEKVGTYIYSYDDEELYQVVGRKLMEKNVTISSAESCTGGAFARAMTSIPGISSVFDRGIVTYSNRAKIQELGVKEETLEQHGAVSEETALEMAQGLQKVSGSYICVSVTGLAGPDGGTEEKPVGLIYIGVAWNGKTACREVRLRNMGREWIRNSALLNMLDMINKLLDGQTD